MYSRMMSASMPTPKQTARFSGKLATLKVGKHQSLDHTLAQVHQSPASGHSAHASRCYVVYALSQ